MKKIVFWVGLTMVFVLSAVGTYIILKSFEKEDVSFVDNQKQEKEIVFYEDGDDKNRLNFLFLGYGGAGHDGGYLSDVVMLVSIDKANKQVTLVSIPRDLWVSVPIQSDKNQFFKVNAAYAIGMDDRTYPLKEPMYKGEYGGGNLSMKVVGDALGINIQQFVAVDFESFKNIIDLLGGVKVEVPKTFDDYYYPVKGLENETCGFSGEMIAEFHAKYSGFELEKQFTCRYEHLHFDKGNAQMDGATALKFVRSRHSNEYGGDFARGERQKAVLFATKDKLLSIYAAKNAESLYKQFQNLVKTDVDVMTFKALAEVIGDPKEYNVKHVGLTEENVLTTSKSINGQFILIPKAGENKWESVRNYIQSQINSN